ncbi:MAG: 5-(carboxyamino)imidazole ribonucleotide mutase [Chloroflexi bacterium]|nr:5-(carboxyamino)imidazole ribonucleotide mutase [Chloroflexota bacterium]
MPLVAIILGSKSDLDVMEECSNTLERLGISHETHVISAHRTPDSVRQFALDAPSRGFEVIIAAAGMAAHLPGIVAAWSALPVIGVPIGKSGMGGLDSLLAIAQMPPGVPVACMAVNGARNAALYAAAVLALKHEPVRDALANYREEQAGT